MMRKKLISDFLNDIFFPCKRCIFCKEMIRRERRIFKLVKISFKRALPSFEEEKSIFLFDVIDDDDGVKNEIYTDDIKTQHK